MTVKYIRWSTVGQSGARQLLDADKYDLVLQEQISGSIAFAKRPKGAELLKLINQGKVTDLYIEELTRLGRNSFDMLTTLNVCEEKQVTVHIQNMNLSSKINGKPNSLFKMFTYIVSVLSEHEKELIKERTEMGKIAARQRGVTFGRKPGTNERKADFLQKAASKKILKYLSTGEYSIREIAKLTDSSTATVIKVKRIGLETRMLTQL
jgi:DNA invertase Pin-like site-specific DNA recombinase